MEKKQKKSFIDRFLNGVEVAGNKLPDPITIFAILAGLVLIASFIFNKMGLTAKSPATGDTLEVVNLLSKEGLHQILTNMVSNFTGFAPLGIVIVAMIGIGVAEHSGLITALMKKTVLSAPKNLIVPVLIFTAIFGSIATDAAYIILPPIAAMIFLSVGRHPLVGMVAAYAAIAGGFSANILITSLDVLLVGITQEAANMVDPNYTGLATMNYYFMAVSTVLLIIVATWVTVKVVEPRFGKYEGVQETLEKVTPLEVKGLRWAGITALVYIAIIVAMVGPENGILRGENGAFLQSPFMSGIVPLMLFLFLIPGIAYGVVVGTIKSDRDVAGMMFKAMSDLSSFIVLAFVAAQMIAFFSWSNIGSILAIKGAEALQALELNGVTMFIGFIFIVATVNLLMASASAKWVLLAPIFVPMFMYLGYSPAVTQMAYRVGDSITNPITPLLAYFAMLLAFAKKYDKNIKMGTLISALIPYSIFFAIMWIILFAVWLLLGLPMGPGETIEFKL
ncbi:AbgT family transporter [Caryophanon tenue]|uniref:Aminobenzoyl-glutamate transporter n=1 Tax=Caryophanon tenue TaxID=33978 RepID=A0A1C0YDX8_9BACL|nr:AbgT family transporter [Caryophanon tenue]OCS85392.1 aminobenzoyl-glutamate transporter [Caryophanon tenue]